MLDDVRSPSAGFNLEIIGDGPCGITLSLVPSVYNLQDIISVFIPVKACWIFIRFVTGVAFYFYGYQSGHLLCIITGRRIYANKV